MRFCRVLFTQWKPGSEALSTVTECVGRQHIKT